MAKEGGRYFIDKDGKERKADPNSDENHIYPAAEKPHVNKTDAELEAERDKPTPVSTPPQAASSDTAGMKEKG